MRTSASARLGVERQRLALDLPRRAPAASRSPRRRASLNTSTRARDSSGAFSSNDGFSVVAPTSTMVPSSITGRKLSCWARLKRWISSTNSSVPLPGLAPGAGRVEHLLQIGDAGEDRAKSARTAGSFRWRAAAPPWSCRCRAAPRRSASRASGSRACGSARHRARADGPGRPPRRASAGAACRRAAAARRSSPAAANRLGPLPRFGRELIRRTRPRFCWPPPEMVTRHSRGAGLG